MSSGFPFLCVYCYQPQISYGLLVLVKDAALPESIISGQNVPEIRKTEEVSIDQNVKQLRSASGLKTLSGTVSHLEIEDSSLSFPVIPHWSGG